MQGKVSAVETRGRQGRGRTVVAYAPRGHGVLLEARVLERSHAPPALDGSIRLDLERAAVLPLEAVQDEAPAVLRRGLARRIARPARTISARRLPSLLGDLAHLCVTVREMDSEAAILLAAATNSSQDGNTAQPGSASPDPFLERRVPASSTHTSPGVRGTSSGTPAGPAAAPWPPSLGRGFVIRLKPTFDRGG